MVVILVTVTGIVAIFVRHQAAQGSKEAARPREVLIEKNQIIKSSSLPETRTTVSAPILVDDQVSSQPLGFLSAMRSFERNEVKGEAFSAELVTETAWPLRDGTRTTRRSTYMIYRDGEGRTRRDLMAEQADSRASAGNQPRVSVVNDPVASLAYVFEHRSSTARKSPLPPQRSLSGEEPLQVDPGTPRLRGSAPVFIMLEPQRVSAQRAGMQREQSASSASTKKESLGRREIEGVMAEGTRFLKTIPLGVFSNEKPIETTTEEWYSRELQIVVLIKLSDPRFGQSEYRLANINRSEPIPTLFKVPTGYKIRE